MADELTFPQTAAALKDLGVAFERFGSALATVKNANVLDDNNIAKLNIIAGAVIDKFIEQVVPNINFAKDEPQPDPLAIKPTP